MNKINIKDKLRLINQYWQPKIVGELNDHQIRIVKIKGEFVFHKHDNEDEMFLVIQGVLTIEFEDRSEILNEGEFIIIPKGTVHRPVANKEAHLLLVEPASVVNTGNVKNEFTVDNPEKI